MNIEYKYDVITKKFTKWKNKCEFIMIHHTAWVSALKSMVDYLSKNKAQVSVHYVIDQEWSIARIWMDNYILWHAGKWTKMKWYENVMNNYAIWIEVISDWIEFTKEQVQSLKVLVTELQKKHNIPNENVIRHKDYSETKIDIWDNFYKVVWFNSFEDWKTWNNLNDFDKLKNEYEELKKEFMEYKENINKCLVKMEETNNVLLDMIKLTKSI